MRTAIQWVAIFVALVVLGLELPKLPGYYRGNAPPTASVTVFGLQRQATPQWILVPHIVAGAYASLFAVASVVRRVLGAADNDSGPIHLVSQRGALGQCLRVGVELCRRGLCGCRRSPDPWFDGVWARFVAEIATHLFMLAHVVLMGTAIFMPVWQLGRLPPVVATLSNVVLILRLDSACTKNDAVAYLVACAIPAAFTATASIILSVFP